MHRGFRIEQLESRLPLSGTGWPDHALSFSFAPDGTTVGSATSNLFAQLDEVSARHHWQSEFQRALQSWAAVSGLEFHQVFDDGSSPSSTAGAGRFGQIRVFAGPIGAIAQTNSPAAAGNNAGDITLNSSVVFSTGDRHDLYSVFLHEIGHALGLSDSFDGAMDPNSLYFVSDGIRPQDVTSIQALYGPPADDPFEVSTNNDSLATATPLSLQARVAVSASAYLSLHDTDYYRVEAPAEMNGQLTVRMNARGDSLLAPRVQVFDAAGVSLGWADERTSTSSPTNAVPAIRSSTGNYQLSAVKAPGASTGGGSAEVRLGGILPQQILYVAASHAIADFSSGAYELFIDFYNLPELPRQHVDLSHNPPTGGQLWSVNEGDDLQAVLHAAAGGDIIELQAGATFTGTFFLPEKPGNEWIYIRSSHHAQLPQGTRVTPEQAHLMPKIVSPDHQPALISQERAHHYRIVGIELTTSHVSNVFPNFNIALFGYDYFNNATGSSSVAELPHHIIFDRSYVHGNFGKVRTGINLNGSHMGIVDSYISDFHDVSDAQAVLVWNGPGPYKFHNSYFESSGENIMFGGNAPKIQDLVPSDIEITDSYFFKPNAWRADHPDYAGQPLAVKNLFELKNAQRVFLDGNVFNNNWASAQRGTAILLTVRNDEEVAPWSVVRDITVTNNVIQNAGGGVHISSNDDIYPSERTRNILVSNNVFDTINSTFLGTGQFFTVSSPVTGGESTSNLRIEHNTMLHNGPANLSVWFDGSTPVASEVLFRNNLIDHGSFGFVGTGTGVGTASLDSFWADYLFQSNLITNTPLPYTTAYPESNEVVPDLLPNDFDAESYSFNSGSVYAHQGTDGRSVGAHFDILDVRDRVMAGIAD